MAIPQPEETPLARTDTRAPAPARPVGRYKSVASKKFRDLLGEANQGDKYNLDDEITVVRGQLALLVKKLGGDEEDMDLDADGLFSRLTKDDAFTKPEAAHICRAVKGAGAVGELQKVLRALRETLEASAKFEQMLSLERVRTFLATCLQVIRQEVKDENVVKAVAARIARLPL